MSVIAPDEHVRLFDELDEALEASLHLEVEQLMMQKLIINQAVEATGMYQTQMLDTLFDGITRHSPEGLTFKRRAEQVAWKQAVRERDEGSFDWTANRPFHDEAS